MNYCDAKNIDSKADRGAAFGYDTRTHTPSGRGGYSNLGVGRARGSVPCADTAYGARATVPQLVPPFLSWCHVGLI